MTEQQSKRFTPKEFLKSRRPERFSDSVIRESGKLDRAVLEFQISTLNRRSLELAFEDFAKSLCEKVVCPNLLEQTGPVAGGDGKTDTQTFPVSEQIKTLRWYVGVNENSHQDRWAFAVSTREDWKQKCREDVRKIVDTDRDYKKIFCITNQYCKSNQRSDIEDSLSQEVGVDVRIFDASWILDRIFKHGYEQLAIDLLSIEVDWKREKVDGPNDYKKKMELQKLQEEISEKINPTDIKSYQVSWILEEAILCKELEYPVIESQGLFDRAANTAEQFGNRFHQFEVHYQYAWAAYWWYENHSLFEAQLEKCFEHAQDIEQSGTWGNFITLLGLYIRYPHQAEVEENTLDIETMIAITNSSLTKMSLDTSRPSNALLAKAYKALLELHQISSVENASEIFTTFEAVVDDSRHLAGFPFQEIYELISSLDFAFSDNECYENLLDKLTTQAVERHGEIEGSLLWLSRGAKRLESGKPYQAIKLIGKSLTGLYKEESKKDIYTALSLLSHAYQKVGLLWASRSSLLLASSLITDEFWKSGDLYPAQVFSYIRLAKSELVIGRINYALSWWELALIIDANLEESAIPDHDYYYFDVYLSHCVLNASMKELVQLEKTLDKLNELQLIFSQQTTLYALGHEEHIDDEFIQGFGDETDLLAFMVKVRDYDFGERTAQPNTFQEYYSSLNSQIMGCDVKLSFPQNNIAVRISEGLLSVLESFFSTCMVDNIVAIEPRLEIEISLDDDDFEISHQFMEEEAFLSVSILLSSFTQEKLITEEATIRNWLFHFIVEIFSKVFKAKDFEKAAHSMLEEDRAIDRSISLGNCLYGLRNILGNNAHDAIHSIFDGSELERYPLVREVSWDSQYPKVNGATTTIKEFKIEAGKAPEGLLNPEKLSHLDTSVQSLIKPRLWDQTTWNGIAFAQYPDMPPLMLLIFENRNEARKILSDLKNEVGANNKGDRLQVSIIRKISKDHHAHYRVVISEQPSSGGATKLINTLSRLNTMEPENDINLTRFLDAYNETKGFLISYSYIEGGYPHIPNNDSFIQLKTLTIIDAWQVGVNSPQLVGIRENDKPYIPADAENVPFFELKEKYFNN